MWDPTQIATLERVAVIPPQAKSGSRVARMLETGEPLLVSPVTEGWLRETARDEEHLELIGQLAATSLMRVPLLARGHALGVLGLASTRTDRYYQPADLALAPRASRTAAVSSDNARLYRQAQDAIRARDEVLRVVWHDPRNPISTISMGASHLLEVGNLVSNALKFTPEGGRVDVGAVLDGEEIRCYVSDTGPGIPHDQLSHVFDRFWQARRTDRGSRSYTASWRRMMGGTGRE